VTFLTKHLGNPVPSPALFNQIGERFRAAVARFATAPRWPASPPATTSRWRAVAWWAPVAALAAAAGLLLKLGWFHPWLTAGVLLDVGVLAAVAAGWPAALF
jgi:hypothetical protein